MEDRDDVAAPIVALRSNFETIEGADDLATEYALRRSRARRLRRHGLRARRLRRAGALSLPDAKTMRCRRRRSNRPAWASRSALADQAHRRAHRQIGVWRCLDDAARRREMRAAGLMTIDGSGAARIAADLAGADSRAVRGLRAARKPHRKRLREARRPSRRASPASRRRRPARTAHSAAPKLVQLVS